MSLVTLGLGVGLAVLAIDKVTAFSVRFSRGVAVHVEDRDVASSPVHDQRLANEKQHDGNLATKESRRKSSTK